MASLAFAFPLRAGKTQRAYLQHTPHGDQVIMYLEGQDLQRTFQELQTSQDPFAVWVRQRIQDLFDGVDLTQTDLGSLSQYVFDGPSADEDEARSHARKVMERLGMISP